MGFGAALALGLVQGFTKNIQDEQKNRELDRTKIDNFDTLFMNAAFEGKLHPQNATILGAAIRDARGELDDKERISIFGKKTAPIDFDVSELAPLLYYNDPNKKDNKIDVKARIGEYEFYRDVRNPTNYQDNIQNINVLSAMPQRDVKKWMAITPEIANDYFSTMNANVQGLMTYVASLQAEEKNLIDLNQIGVTKQIDSFEQLYQKYNPDYQIGTMYDKSVFQAVSKGLSNTDTSPQSVHTPLVQGSTANAGDTVIFFTPENEGEQLALNMMLSKMQDVDVSAETGPNSVAGWWSAYTGIAGFGGDYKSQLADAALGFGDRFGIDGFNVAGTSFGMMSPEVAADAFDYLYEATDGNPMGMALVLGMYQTPIDNTVKEKARSLTVPNSAKKEVPVLTAKGYAAQVLLGKDATENDFQKIVETNRNLDLVLGETGLGELMRMAGEFKGPALISKYAGVIESLESGFKFLVGADSDTTTNKQRFMTQATNTMVISQQQADSFFVGTDGRYYETEAAAASLNSKKEVRFVTDEYLDGLFSNIERRRQQGNEQGGQSMGQQYAQFEALRISLAFLMARAADPSGRLSNQDIEAQLIRLGTNFDSPEMMQARIGQAIKDFEEKKGRYEVIVQIAGDATGKVTNNDKKRILGAHSLGVLSKKAGFSTLGAAGAGKKDIEVNPVGDTYVINGIVYMPDGQGGFIDGEQFNPAPKEIIDAIRLFQEKVAAQGNTV
jgi:hypothetical protein